MRNDIYDLQAIETHIDFVVQLEEEMIRNDIDINTLSKRSNIPVNYIEGILNYEISPTLLEAHRLANVFDKDAYLLFVDKGRIKRNYLNDVNRIIHPEWYKPIKKLTRLVLDEEVIKLYKSMGKSYKNKINDDLRKAVGLD